MPDPGNGAELASDGSSTMLEKLAGDIATCRICRDGPGAGKQPLPHEPRPVVRLSATARLCIAGQAPGQRVHKTGIPFNDPSGDRLREWMGVDRTVFYDTSRIAIVPMGFCFPGYDAKGGDLPPRTECRNTWHDEIFKHMPQLELILVIGQYAQGYHLGKRRARSLTETVANWRSFTDAHDENASRSGAGAPTASGTFAPRAGPAVLPLPHPSWRNNAWLRKNPWFEADVLPYLKEKVRDLVLE